MHDRNTMASTPDTLFRKKSASKLLHSGIFSDIEIKVGTTTFKVHKAILCTRCEYFRRAFDATHGFKEPLTNIITLEEPDTPEVVRAMLEHIHRGDYTATEDTEKQFLVDIGVLVAAEML
ncbi:BTB/POZ protein [Phyllosticta citricarpa]